MTIAAAPKRITRASPSTAAALVYQQRIESADPVLGRVPGRKISPIFFGLAVALGINLVRFAVASYEGNILTRDHPVGFLRDPATFINAAVAAAVFAWYAWTPAGLGRLIAGLIANGVFKTRDETEIDQLVGRIANGRWSWLALLATLAVTAVEIPFYLRRMRAGDAWSMATPLSVTLSLLWAGSGVYALTRVLTYYALARAGFKRLFTRFPVRIRPLHPDRSGGLAPLGAFAIRISYLMTIIGVFIVVTVLTRSYLSNGRLGVDIGRDVAAALVAFAVLSAFVFFALPAVAHDSMLKAKNRLLLRINRRFEGEYQQLHGRLGAADADLEPGLKRLENLQKLYETTARFPVWPLDVQTVSRFLTSWVTPVLIALVTKWLTSLLSGGK